MSYYVVGGWYHTNVVDWEDFKSKEEDKMKLMTEEKARSIVAGATVKCSSCKKTFWAPSTKYKVFHKSSTNHLIQSVP